MRILTIQGIFDGKQVELLEHVPFQQKKRVLITFLDDGFSERDTIPEKIDPIHALRGSAKGSHLTEKLVKAKGEDKAFEYSVRKESKKYLTKRCGINRT